MILGSQWINFVAFVVQSVPLKFVNLHHLSFLSVFEDVNLQNIEIQIPSLMFLRVALSLAKWICSRVSVILLWLLEVLA